MAEMALMAKEDHKSPWSFRIVTEATGDQKWDSIFKHLATILIC